MNARSFENLLRDVTVPPAAATARASAREAALAEFTRVREASGTSAASCRSRSASTSRWAPWNPWFGGLATACVIVLSATIVYQLPPADRLPSTSVELEPAVVPELAIRERAEAEAMPPVEVEVQTAVAPPAIAAVAPMNKAAIDTSAETNVDIADVARIEAPITLAEQPDQSRLDSQAPTPNVVTGGAPNAPGSTATIASDATTATRLTSEASAERKAEIDLVGAGAAPQTALAQPEGIVVTGSMIRRPRNQTPADQIRSWPEAYRDDFQHFDSNPVKRVADAPVSTFSIDVDTASYSFVRRMLNEGRLPPPDAVRVEEMVNYFDYQWPAAESRKRPFAPTVTVSDSPWGTGKKLIHIGIKGYELPAREQPDVNLVLLLDVSGSMSSPDKLPLAQRAMTLLLDTLRPTDTVAIVVYAGAAGQVLAPTPVREREAIERALYALHAGGSTAGAAGIQLAYTLAEQSFRDGGVNRILLATDGDFNVGITNQEELKRFVARQREKQIYLSVLGFGAGNYHDAMAQTLAQNGNGVAAYIDTLQEARKVLVQEAMSSLFPIAKDVKIQVEFNPETVAEYRLVGYETRALNREDFNNDQVDAGDIGSGHSVTAIYEITPVDSPARLFDESRYADREQRSAKQGRNDEYGFLRIRYKLPDENSSRLIERAITLEASVPTNLKSDLAFATAVAGFGQLLRQNAYTGALSFEDVISQAQAGLAEDPNGYRREFVELVRQAQRLAGR